MLIQRGIMKRSLDGSDGKSSSGRLVYSVRYFPRNVYCGKGCVVAEGEPVGISGLPVFKPCVLLCIAVDELNLESGVVKEEDLGGLHISIRAEKDFSYHFVPASEFSYHDLDFPSEGFPFYSGTEQGNILAVDFNSVPDEHTRPEIMNVHGSVKFFGPAASALLRAGVKIMHHRVITQPADDIESEPDSACDEVVTREQTVPHKDVGYAEQLFLMVEYRSETLCRLIIPVLLHVLKIERSAAFRGERHCLHREKESRIAYTGGHLGETKNLKTPLYGARAPRPIPAQTGSLLSGFAEKAVVKGYGGSVAVVSKKHPAVEGAPVELLLEILPEAAFARVSMPGHRQEIQSSVYCQYQNHCLDEEALEIFSYFSSAIERGCDNRFYLVKRLDFIHNLLIVNYKVTKNLALGQILLPLILLKINKMNMLYSTNSSFKFLTNYCESYVARN